MVVEECLTAKSSFVVDTKVLFSSRVPSNSDIALLELVEVGEDGKGTSSKDSLEDNIFFFPSLNILDSIYKQITLKQKFLTF